MTDDDRLHIACPDCLRAVRVPRARRADAPGCPACHTPLLRQAPVELDDRGFADFIGRNDLPVLVDVWAPWCGPCRQYAPVIAQVAARLRGDVVVAKLNSDAAPTTSSQLNIRSIPTTVLFHGGRELGRLSGAVPGTELMRFMAQHLGGNKA